MIAKPERDDNFNPPGQDVDYILSDTSVSARCEIQTAGGATAPVVVKAAKTNSVVYSTSYCTTMLYLYCYECMSTSTLWSMFEKTERDENFNSLEQYIGCDLYNTLVSIWCKVETTGEAAALVVVTAVKANSVVYNISY